MTIKRLAAAALAASLLSAPPIPAHAQADGFFVPDWVGVPGWIGSAPGGAPALAPGALTAAPYSYRYSYPAPYPYVYARNGCLVNAPVYDDWGGFLGYQRLRVAC